MDKYTVKKTGGTWSVLKNGVLYEGGFFNRDVAIDLKNTMNSEQKKEK